MDLQAQGELMVHAQEFVKSAGDHLKMRLGRPSTEDEHLFFCNAVAFLNASFCYAKLYEDSGRERADALLQLLFKQTGAAVQSRGIPVTLEMNLKSIPMEEEEEQGAIDQGRPPLVLCKCVTDAQGQCQSCLKELQESLSHITDVAAMLNEFQVKERCPVCVQRLLDSTFAQVISEKFGTVNQAVRDATTVMATQMGSANGVTAFPQAQAAFAAVKTKQGAGA